MWPTITWADLSKQILSPQHNRRPVPRHFPSEKELLLGAMRSQLGPGKRIKTLGKNLSGFQGTKKKKKKCPSSFLPRQDKEAKETNSSSEKQDGELSWMRMRHSGGEQRKDIWKKFVSTFHYVQGRRKGGMSKAWLLWASPHFRPPGCNLTKDSLATNRRRAKPAWGELRQSVTVRANPRDLTELLTKPEQNAKLQLHHPGVGCGVFHLQPFLQCFSENVYGLPPWRGGVTQTTWKVIYSLLTTEIIQHSKLGELMDDLTLAQHWQQALGRPAVPLSAGGQRKDRWLLLLLPLS